MTLDDYKSGHIDLNNLLRQWGIWANANDIWGKINYPSCSIEQTLVSFSTTANIDDGSAMTIDRMIMELYGDSDTRDLAQVVYVFYRTDNYEFTVTELQKEDESRYAARQRISRNLTTAQYIIKVMLNNYISLAY